MDRSRHESILSSRSYGRLSGNYTSTGRGLQIEQFPQALGLGAADGDFGLFFVVHAELVAGLEPGDDFADVVDVDDVAAVDAPEEGGVEEFEEVFEGAALGLAFEALGDDADDAFVDGGEADFGLVDEEKAALGLDDEALGLGLARCPLGSIEEPEQGVNLRLGQRAGGVAGHAAADALDSLLDAGAVKGLEQIIDGVHVKGADGVLVISGGEDDLGHGLGIPAGLRLALFEEALDGGEAIEAGHLDVEEDEVGVVLGNEVHGLDAVAALGEHVDAADLIEEVLELFAG